MVRTNLLEDKLEIREILNKIDLLSIYSWQKGDIPYDAIKINNDSYKIKYGDNFIYYIPSINNAYVEIDNKTYTQSDLKGLLKDLTPQEQFERIQSINLKEIQSELEKAINCKLDHVEFRIEYQESSGKPLLQISVKDNLAKMSGPFSLGIKEATLDLSPICFYIDRTTGEQKICDSTIYLMYTTKENGHNGIKLGYLNIDDNLNYNFLKVKQYED